MPSNIQAQKSALPRMKGRCCSPVSSRESWQVLKAYANKGQSNFQEQQFMLIQPLFPSVRLSALLGTMLSLEPQSGQ